MGTVRKRRVDVHYHGQESKSGMKSRKYNGYELSIYYGRNSITGTQYISYQIRLVTVYSHWLLKTVALVKCAVFIRI